MITAVIVLATSMAVTWANPFFPGHTCHKPHEIYLQCGNNCAPTCGNPFPPPGCIQTCQPGCFCREGFIRDDDGVCVRSRRCRKKKHKECGANEKFKRCKRTCEPTCKHRKPKECKEPCFDWACQCKAGFVRDKDGDCVPWDLCPNRADTCGKNEIYSNDTCVPESICQFPRCENQKYDSGCPNYCTNGGCVCKEGFVRTNKGKCVTKKHCHSSSSDSSSSDSDECWDRCRRRKHSSSRECEDECGNWVRRRPKWDRWHRRFDSDHSDDSSSSSSSTYERD